MQNQQMTNGIIRCPILPLNLILTPKILTPTPIGIQILFLAIINMTK